MVQRPPWVRLPAEAPTLKLRYDANRTQAHAVRTRYFLNRNRAESDVTHQLRREDGNETQGQISVFAQAVYQPGFLVRREGRPVYLTNRFEVFARLKTNI